MDRTETDRMETQFSTPRRPDVTRSSRRVSFAMPWSAPMSQVSSLEGNIVERGQEIEKVQSEPRQRVRKPPVKFKDYLGFSDED